MKTWFLSIGYVLALLPSSFVHAQSFEIPPNDQFYTQTFDAITADQEATIEKVLAEYQKETSNDIAILVLESMSGASITESAVDVGRKWRLGTEHGNGILILAALADREVTIQVGDGLEGAVPDIVAKGVIEEEITPYFKKGEYTEGFLAGIDALKKHIGGEYTVDRYAEGGGVPFLNVMVFVILITVNYFGALMARSKSWWLGGVLGGVIGIVLTILFGWWLSIPFFVVIGLLFDYLVSRHPPGPWRGGRGGGGIFPGGRSGGSGGGFGGFGGGGRFSGGGASGKW